ncbi:MAG TPA: hypothetical protein VF503_19030 [Sphingobium sp.]|uniref:hypothetical protein n=1 Tax=Sphingobium sp. TaxID=1912891 RepID=UPI002ED0CB79
MKADLISLQAVIIGVVILLAYFGLRWFMARRPRCRRMMKTAPVDTPVDTTRAQTISEP